MIIHQVPRHTVAQSRIRNAPVALARKLLHTVLQGI